VTLDRVRVQISGGVGGAGFMNWYFEAATTAQILLMHDLIDAVKVHLPLGFTYAFPTNGDRIDETTGKLVSGWTATAVPSVAGGGSYTQPTTGFHIQWRGQTVINGHRPIGKALFVPAAAGAFSSGVISTAAVATIQAAADNFITNVASFRIWHRPVYDTTTSPPTLKRPGAVYIPTVARVTNLPVVLRSRRD
jgi:hypothetical protein